MRDFIKILAAGTIMTAYALIAPSVVDAVPAGASTGKPFAQRLARAEAAAPVSAIEVVESRFPLAVTTPSTLPRLVRLEIGS